MGASLTVTLFVTCIAFTGIWLINVLTKDAGVIDYYWGPGFAVIALVHISFHGATGLHQWLLLAAVVLWAARLAGHLVHRHHGSTQEDGRYRAMRDSGGPSFWWTSLFTVFLLQATLLWLIAAPMHVAFAPGAGENVMAGLYWLGLAIFGLGIAIEWIADRQLANGKRAVARNEPETSLVTDGLWGISRHPNYLGEIALWWGLALSAYAISGHAIAFAGPALLTLVIAAVSLPLTEQHMVRTRPDYAAYMARVPALIWPFHRRRHSDAQRHPAE